MRFNVILVRFHCFVRRLDGMVGMLTNHKHVISCDAKRIHVTKKRMYITTNIGIHWGKSDIL